MKAVTFFLFLILFSSNVNALAVASDYLENKTLFLEDGTSKLYGIRLQNPDSKQTQIQLTYDDTVAKVIDYEEIYTLPPKTSKAILFNITAPENAKPDHTYKVGYTVHQLSGEQILLNINKNFNVRIIRNPDKFYISDIYAYYPLFIAVLVFIFFLLRKKILRKKKFK